VKITDPLAVAQLYLQLNPNQAENRAIRKLLRAIAQGKGTLRASEALLFQGELGELTAALLDANLQGRYAVEDWRLAASI
jgi:hypothetical protein